MSTTASPIDIWNSLSPAAEVVGGFATAIAAFFAALAITYAHYQIRSAQRLSREQHAYAAFNDLLKLYVEYPNLSNSTLTKAYISVENFRGVEKRSSEQASQYLWFLSYVLTTSEWIFDACPKRDDWKNALRAQILHHREALIEVWPTIKENYKSGYVSLVDGIIYAQA